jgi:hypothetical protein
MEHYSCDDRGGSSTKKTELMIVRQALLDATQEYTTKYLSSSNLLSTAARKSSYNNHEVQTNEKEEEEEEEDFYLLSRRAKKIMKDGEETKHRNTTAASVAEIQFCHMLTQDMIKIIEHKDVIAIQNHHLAIEKERLEKRRDEIQSELFLLRMQIQQLKGECKALLQKKSSNKEWDFIEAANVTILNLQSLISSAPNLAQVTEKEVNKLKRKKR